MARPTSNTTIARTGRPGVATALFVLGTACLGGYLATTLATPVVRNRYFPWLVGRSLGLAAYICMVALVLAGIWLRHPWRFRWPLFRPETVLRYHAALAGATVLLVAGHLVSLAGDRYAGVGWLGAILPGHSSYRTVPVALGVCALWACLLVAGSTRLGGCIIGRHWLSVHRLAMPIFLAVFVHGVLAGTDTARLRWMYATSGGLVLLMWLSRHLAAGPQVATYESTRGLRASRVVGRRREEGAA